MSDPRASIDCAPSGSHAWRGGGPTADRPPSPSSPPSFALGDVPITKMFGIGLAAAILIDATLGRMGLVPATMELLGDRNWWLPGWLDRLLPNIHVERHEATDAEFDLRDLIGRPRDSVDVPTTSGV